MEQVPDKIGEYQIESVFRKGGSAIIYFAIHPKTKERVVIKTLLPKYIKDRSMLQRLMKEARVMGMVNHPNIVKFYDLGRWEEGVFIAMEYVQGISLRQFIRQKALSPQKVLDIILQTAYGLGHLHSHGIVHRDLKPENILITDSGHIKLIDFGIALFLNKEMREETKFRFAGTLSYMSPEQKGPHPESISYPSDIYSLGLITYELYTGNSSVGLVNLSLLPKSLQNLLEKALQEDPKKRYQDIVDFIADLTLFLKNLNEDKEEKSSDLLFEMLKESRTFLIAEKPPALSTMEMGMAIRSGLSHHTPYFDVFRLSPTKMGIFIAEPNDIGVHSLAASCMLKGIVRTAILQTDDPKEILLTVKRVLLAENKQHFFAAALLLFDEANSRHTYISCNMGSLWNYPDPKSPKRVFDPDNPLLGPDREDLNVLEENWTPGATLIFSSIHMPEKLDFTADLDLAPEPLAHKVLEKLFPYNTQAIVLTFKSIY